ncbi:hypothetical protein SARC_02945 [Sphaeroforma arctica JP610]|uniref:Mitochondrial pyruvate carrier n=1 Tax=Sphaeroforma arctica JP610 TaxID=667725 RepID=A0A0L0G9C4_9EUKA|nr:hypothetical protein SARC_02945 [Sphaeroforma arctica JP610]KNC84863.1 hypothetical protein SARC_02945 [Sphaeroforma arctica JP610]|eukprot:XP_014158765.1 hypothetical protein SARC_02945 [Sphaeroforma arctica JP610]
MQAANQAAPALLRGWVGNQRLFANKVALSMEKSVPGFAFVNNVTNSAPLWKWALAIVPLTQAVTGEPSVDKLDLNQSLSLTFTGIVWSYYATIIQPQNAGSKALCAVNIALLTSNGYNAYRKMKYDGVI